MSNVTCGVVCIVYGIRKQGVHGERKEPFPGVVISEEALAIPGKSIKFGDLKQKWFIVPNGLN